MFTGIIEHAGTIESLSVAVDGGRVTISAPSLAASLVVSNSIAVNGCCLTVVSLDNKRFSADLSGETIRRTSFSDLKPGAKVNLEQPLTAGKEFGGHFVLGHVDCIGRVVDLRPDGENWIYAVEVPREISRYVVNKGSITIDGISLTVARWQNNIAEIAVIPYTYAHTNLAERKPGDAVNLEADMLAKHLERLLIGRKKDGETTPPLQITELIRQGF
jgi:riboflavin synthase